MQKLFSFTTILFVVVNLIQKVECRVTYSSDADTEAAKTCNQTDGTIYMCTVGYCCDEGQCCLYVYELWWFWLAIGVILLISCCSFYHRHQKKVERQMRRQRARRRHRGAYGGVCNYPGPPRDENILGYSKLPLYNDVIKIPPTSSPPPPYSARRRSIHTIACLQPNQRGETMMTIVDCNITSSMLSVASLSHYVPELLARNSIPSVLPPSNRNSEGLTSVGNRRSNERAETSVSQEKAAFLSELDGDTPALTTKLN